MTFFGLSEALPAETELAYDPRHTILETVVEHIPGFRHKHVPDALERAHQVEVGPIIRGVTAAQALFAKAAEARVHKQFELAAETDAAAKKALADAVKHLPLPVEKKLAQ